MERPLDTVSLARVDDRRRGNPWTLLVRSGSVATHHRFTAGVVETEADAFAAAAALGYGGPWEQRATYCYRLAQPAEVRRYIDTAALHGWLYLLAGQWILEHCTAGEWHACPLGLGPEATERQVNARAMRDLKRKPHAGRLPELLKGSHHA